jgi:hypothetical protein
MIDRRFTFIGAAWMIAFIVYEMWGVRGSLEFLLLGFIATVWALFIEYKTR